LEAIPNKLRQEKNLINCGSTKSVSGLGRRDDIFGLLVVAEAIEIQALEEFGYTESKRNCTKGGWRVDRFARFVYGDNGGRFLA